jgi:limonene-1,2-epoxide hydrolase
MQITTATATTHEIGPLTRVVRQFTAAQGAAMAKGIKSPSDWDPVAEFVATGEFRRVGAYLEEFDWPAYTRFLTDWADGGTRFEFDELHVTEAGNAVFQEIEERHFHGDTFIRKNVIAVYRFTEDGKIKHLDIYEQATDSGEWIKQAAAKSTLG